MKRWRRWAVLALCGGLLGAASCEDDEPPPAPFDAGSGGGFTATVVDGNRLVIEAADGRVLLDGLPPGSVGAEAPPLVGFAARTDVTTYEMQFGAIKPTITPEGNADVEGAVAPSSG